MSKVDNSLRDKIESGRQRLLDVYEETGGDLTCEKLVKVSQEVDELIMHQLRIRDEKRH